MCIFEQNGAQRSRLFGLGGSKVIVSAYNAGE